MTADELGYKWVFARWFAEAFADVYVEFYEEGRGDGWICSHHGKTLFIDGFLHEGERYLSLKTLRKVRERIVEAYGGGAAGPDSKRKLARALEAWGGLMALREKYPKGSRAAAVGGGQARRGMEREGVGVGVVGR